MMVYGLTDAGMLISSVLIGIIVYVMFMWIFFNNLLKEMRFIIIKGNKRVKY